MAVPSLEDVVSRARADGKSEHFIEALKSDYRRRFQTKSYETGGQVDVNSDVPALEDVLQKARDDGKDENFLNRLEADYYRRYPQMKPKATGTEGDNIERVDEVDDYGIERNEFGGIDNLPKPVDPTVVAQTGTVNPTYETAAVENTFDRVVKEKGWSYSNGRVTNSQGHVMFENGEWTQFGISALRIPQNVVSENNWTRHGDGRIEDEYGGVVWDPETGLTNLESEESIIGRLNLPEVEEIDEDSDLAATETQVVENATTSVREAVENDEVLQPIIQNIENTIAGESASVMQEIKSKYNLSNPEEYKKAQEEYSQWYLNRFNELAEGNSTYRRRMNIYTNRMLGYIQENSEVVFNEQKRRRANEDWVNATQNFTVPGVPGAGELFSWFTRTFPETSRSVYVGVKQIEKMFKDGEAAIVLNQMQGLEEFEANIDPNKTYRMVATSNGEILGPEGHASYYRSGTGGDQQVIEVDAETYGTWIKDKRKYYETQILGKFATSIDLNETLQQFQVNESYYNPDGSFKWDKLFDQQTINLIATQGPQFVTSRVPGLSMLMQTGEIYISVIDDFARQRYGKGYDELTNEEILSILDNEEINMDQILQRGFVAGGLDYVASGEVLRTTKGLLRNGLKNGFKHIGNWIYSGTAEAATEGTQSLITEVTVLDHTGKPIDWNAVRDEGTAGGIIGLLLPLGGGSIRLTGEVADMARQYGNAVAQSTDTDELIRHKDEILVPEVEDAVEKGEITREEGDALIRDIDLTTQAAQQVPDDLSAEGKERAIPLIKEREELKEQIKGKDKAFTQTQRERIKAIDEELASIGQAAEYVAREPEEEEEERQEEIPQTALEFEAIILGREIEELEGRRDYLQGELARRGTEEGFVNSNEYKQMLAEFKRLNDQLYYKNKGSIKYDRTTDEGAPVQDPDIEGIKTEFREANEFNNNSFKLTVEDYAEQSLKEGRRAESDLFNLWREAGVERAPENIGQLRAKKAELDPGLYKRLLVDYYIAGDYLYNPELDVAELIAEIKSLADVEMVKTHIDQEFDYNIQDLTDANGNIRMARVVWLSADPENKNIGSSWSVDPDFPQDWLAITNREAFDGDPYVVYATVKAGDVQNFLPVGQYASGTQSEIMVLSENFPSENFTWERLDTETFQPVKVGEIKEDGRTQEERTQAEQERQGTTEEGVREGAERQAEADRRRVAKETLSELYSGERYAVGDSFMNDYYNKKVREIRKNKNIKVTDDKEVARKWLVKHYVDKEGMTESAANSQADVALNSAGLSLSDNVYVNKDIKKPDTPRHEEFHNMVSRYGMWEDLSFLINKNNVLVKEEKKRVEKYYPSFQPNTYDYNNEFLSGLVGKWEVMKELGIDADLAFDSDFRLIMDTLLESAINQENYIDAFDALIEADEEQIAKSKPVKRKFGPGFDSAVENANQAAADPEVDERELVKALTQKQLMTFLVESEQHAENLKEKVQYEEKPVTKQAKEDPEFFATEEQKAEAEGIVLTAIAAGKSNKETEQGAKTLIKKISDKKIAARLAYALQDSEREKVGSEAFKVGKALFPNIRQLAKEMGVSPKRAEGTVGLYALQFLVDAGLIEFRKFGPGRRAELVIVLKDPDKFHAFIQSQNPKKIEKLVPRGSMPYYEGAPQYSQPTEDDIDIVGGKFSQDIFKDLSPENYPEVYEEANNAALTGISINKSMLRFYQQIMRKPVFTFRDKKLGSGERKTKRQKLVTNMETAEMIGSREFWQRPVFELRSRIRSAMRALNHQGDKQGLSLLLTKPYKLEESGVKRLLLQAADTFGYKGRDFDERIEFARENFETWMEWASDPKKYYNEISQAKEFWIFAATINELFDALTWAKANDSSITEFESGLPHHQDQTASGLGIITTIMKDPQHASTLNIDEDQERGDPYTELGLEFFEKQGVWEQKDIDESIEVAKQIADIEAQLNSGRWIDPEKFQALVDEKQSIIKGIGKKRMEELRKAFFSRPEVKDHYTRKMGKIVAMTKYYGSKEYGMRDNVMSELSPEVEHFPGLPEAWVWEVAKELNAAADARFPAAKRYMDTMSAIGRALAEEGMSFTGKNNKFPMFNRPTERKKGQIKEQKYRGENTINKTQKINLVYHEYTNEADASAAETQAPSFVTHASDAQIPAWLFLHAKELHGYLLTIHDNFLVPAGLADKLEYYLHQAYKETFSGNYLEDIVVEMFGGDREAAQPFLDMLQIGDLDISEMDLSDHIFSSGNGLTRLRDYGEATNVFEQRESQTALEEAKVLLIEEQSNKVSEDKRCT